MSTGRQGNCRRLGALLACTGVCELPWAWTALQACAWSVHRTTLACRWRPGCVNQRRACVLGWHGPGQAQPACRTRAASSLTGDGLPGRCRAAACSSQPRARQGRAACACPALACLIVVAAADHAKVECTPLQELSKEKDAVERKIDKLASGIAGARPCSPLLSGPCLCMGQRRLRGRRAAEQHTLDPEV